jgi:two-component system response regulator HydG
VRELANVMERAVAVAAGNRADLEDLPTEIRLAQRLPSGKEGIRPLVSIEKEYILAILEAKAGNRKQASEALGIGMATLQRKLRSYRTEVPRKATS